MDLNKNNMKKLLAIVAFAILLLVGLQNLPSVMAFFGFLLKLIFPFLLGLGIAFVLNVPLRFVERVLFRGKEAAGFRKKLRRPLCLAITILLVGGVVFIVMFLILPEVGRTLPDHGGEDSSFPYRRAGLDHRPDCPASRMGRLADHSGYRLEQAQHRGGGAAEKRNRRSAEFHPQRGDLGIRALFNFFLGFVFAVYVLMQKEKLGRQSRKVLYAYLPEAKADRVISVCSLANKTFSSFLSGQCLEACILGALFFIALTIFRFPYALLISVLTAFTALIPVFGAIIGCVIGAFFILIVNPMQALWFVILFKVIQQIEGNLIYPHVVGNSVNLPSIWVLVAVTIGGSVMGVAGMLLFIPLCRCCTPCSGKRWANGCSGGASRRKKRKTRFPPL